MKVAIVHDWLTGMRGGERCLQAFLRLYPQADVFALLHVPGATSAEIDSHVRGTSFLQKLPGVKRFYRLALPLYPAAVRGFRFEGYDFVISLSHSAVKNIRVPQGVPHVCYCFTPMRYIWDQAENYFGRGTALVWPVLQALRSWDLEGGMRPDVIVAISSFVAARIRCFYEREAEVIYPPVDTSWVSPAGEGEKGQAFLYAGALVPYKRVDLVVDAFNRLGEPLWVVGRGPEEKALRRMAGANIRFLGPVPDADLAGYYRRCRALVFPGKEDFGLIPIECQAAGRPVVGLHHGGLKETLNGVMPWQHHKPEVRLVPPLGLFEASARRVDASGVFIPTTRRGDRARRLEALLTSLRYFIEHEDEFRPEACILQAHKFRPTRFYCAWNSMLMRNGLGRFVSPRVSEMLAAANAE